ncbi:MAG: hypothetical protein HFG32_02175 [Eubacterium sp.]|nr:hypothetical protein [Eubacterium sp.]
MLEVRVNVAGTWREISPAYVHMEVLENAKEQSKESNEAGCTPLGGI